MIKITTIKSAVRIVLVGLLRDTNLGDQAIFEATRYEIETYFQKQHMQVYFAYIDIGVYVLSRYFSDNTGRLYKKIKNKTYQILLKRSYTKYDYVTEKSRQFIKHNTDAVIFVGGGIIKFRRQDYLAEMIEIVLKRAAQVKVPVMFSGVGVEGYDENSSVCQRLKVSFNQKCVKVVTTRDDIDTLRENYLCGNNHIRSVKVSDAACILNRLYTPDEKKKNTIGIGVVRDGLFSDYGYDVSAEKLLNLYADIYHQLSRLGKRCRIFTNGAEKDQAFAEKLVSFLGLGEYENDVLCSRPETVRDLVSCITCCEAVIAVRLHASIIAYSYGVPFVGLVWNSKQLFFASAIDCPDRLFEVSNFNAERIVAKLLKIIGTDTPDKEKQIYIRSNSVELEAFLSENIKRK